MSSFIRDTSQNLNEKAARERYFGYIERCLMNSRQELRQLNDMWEDLEPARYEKLKRDILHKAPDDHELQLRCEWLVLMP